MFNRRFKRGFYLLLPVLIFFILFEFGLSRVNCVYSAKRALVSKVIGQTQILVMGSSHLFFGVDPAQFPVPAFNFAEVSESVRASAQLVDKYLPEAKNLKLIIFGISYSSLDLYLSRTPESWRNFYYRRFFQIPGDSGALDLLDLRSYSLYYLFGRKKSWELAVHGFSDPRAQVMDNHGWQAVSSDGHCDARDREAARVRMKDFAPFMNSEVRASNLKAIEHTVKLAADHGVRVAFVTLPVCESMRAVADAQVRNESREAIRALTRRYSTTSYHDYFDDPRFPATDFSDTDHLNSRGAVRISRLLNDEIWLPMAHDSHRLAALR